MALTPTVHEKRVPFTPSSPIERDDLESRIFPQFNPSPRSPNWSSIPADASYDITDDPYANAWEASYIFPPPPPLDTFQDLQWSDAQQNSYERRENRQRALKAAIGYVDGLYLTPKQIDEGIEMTIKVAQRFEAYLNG